MLRIQLPNVSFYVGSTSPKQIVFISDRSYLRLNELDFKQLPLDVSEFSVYSIKPLMYLFQIIIQAIASLLVIMYSVLHISGEFKEIKASADLDNKSWDTYKNIPSFYTFSHRGKAFAGWLSFLIVL